jgi:hypothetical protein
MSRVWQEGAQKCFGLIQTEMAQKPMLRAEVHARAMRASQDVKRAEVWVGARCAWRLGWPWASAGVKGTRTGGVIYKFLQQFWQGRAADAKKSRRKVLIACLLMPRAWQEGTRDYQVLTEILTRQGSQATRINLVEKCWLLVLWCHVLDNKWPENFQCWQKCFKGRAATAKRSSLDFFLISCLLMSRAWQEPFIVLNFTVP